VGNDLDTPGVAFLRVIAGSFFTACFCVTGPRNVADYLNWRAVFAAGVLDLFLRFAVSRGPSEHRMISTLTNGIFEAPFQRQARGLL
jgi:hypothetical protein